MNSQLQYTDLTKGYNLATLITFLAIIAVFITFHVWIMVYQTDHLLSVEIMGGILLLVVLGLEIRFIFQPLVHSVIEKTKTLEAANAQYSQTQQILESAKQIAEQSARWRARFLATMSHEIRTPMNGVMGMTQLLLGTRLTTEQREFVNTIRLSGESLLTVINDILDFSKIEAGRMTLEEQPFIISDCIEETFDLFAAKALSNNVDLFYWIDDHVPSCILGDVTRVKQVLNNLVSNALKFTKEGEVFVSVNYLIQNDHQDAQMIQIAVTDSGIGIPEDKLDTIFESFQQADSSIARQYGGSGLGLSICKQLCQLMGGNIRVKSKVGKGSAFYFTLPAKVAHLPEVFSPMKLQDKHILVVDDNVTHRRILSLQLQRWRAQVQTCASGEQALLWLATSQPCDIAILDMAMPEMNGLQLALQIRQLSQRQQLPLVLLSSVDKIEIDLEISQSLFAASISKPIKRIQLFDTLAGVLSGKQRLDDDKMTTPFCNNKHLAKRYPLRILLAEDDPVSQQLATLLFQSMGYTIDIVTNGMEVLESLNKHRYHLIFMDIQMPLMNGFVTTSAILDQYPLAIRPKIIALTANALEEDQNRCLAAGMDDYLSKPIQYQEIRAILEKWGKICHFSNRNSLTHIEHTGLHPPSLLDLERVEEIKTLAGTRFLPKVIQPFLSQTTELVNNITLLTQRGDAEALGKVVHQLKGSSASLGATYLANLCKQIESKSRQQDWDDIQMLCTELKASYVQTQDQLIRIGQLYG